MRKRVNDVVLKDAHFLELLIREKADETLPPTPEACDRLACKLELYRELGPRKARPIRLKTWHQTTRYDAPCCRDQLSSPSARLKTKGLRNGASSVLSCR
jgi:hypothetical protein